MKKAPPAKQKSAKPPTADDHRKLAEKHRAKSMLHEAKATILDVDNPPKPAKAGKRNRLFQNY